MSSVCTFSRDIQAFASRICESVSFADLRFGAIDGASLNGVPAVAALPGADQPAGFLTAA